jgi:hypothetical protein
MAAATQQPTAALVFFSCGISISRLPAPESKAMYTNTGIATADTTVHREAQHDLTPSESIERKYFISKDSQMIGTKVPIVFGSYAKKAKDSSADTVLFTWSCGVYLDGLPFANLGPLIEKVDFTLHKSFENV